MAPSPAKKLATYEDLLALPEHLTGEIVDGELHVSPRPGSLHARASSKLGSRLGGPFDDGIGGPGGWILLHEPELHIVGQILVPDLAGWRRERMPEMPATPSFELAPDWACEVLSPSTEAFDRSKKMPVYGKAGVRHLWLIRPEAKMLEVYRLDGARWLVVGTFTDDKVRAEPFDAVEVDLAGLWAR